MSSHPSIPCPVQPIHSIATFLRDSVITINSLLNSSSSILFPGQLQNANLIMSPSFIKPFSGFLKLLNKVLTAHHCLPYLTKSLSRPLQPDENLSPSFSLCYRYSKPVLSNTVATRSGQLIQSLGCTSHISSA